MSRLTAENFVRVVAYGQTSTPDERGRLKSDIAANSDAINAAAKNFEAATPKEDGSLIDKLNQGRAAYRSSRSAYFELIEGGKKDEAAAYLTSTLRPAYAAYLDMAREAIQANAQRGRIAVAAVESESVHTTYVVIGVTLAALVIGAAVGLAVIGGTNRTLFSLAEQLGQGAEQTAAAAQEVSTSSQSIASGASEQAASIEETSASLEEILSMTKRNAESAAKAKNLSNQTRQAAEAGAGSMSEMKQAMDGIKDSSASIAKIVKTIDEIAFQTNILALNAAVEAARAGEAGAGFAVVADEVRSLAQRSAQSAKETAVKIEDSVSRSEHGVRISAKVAQSFEEIVIKARSVDELVGEISTGSSEQTEGISQVTTAVAQMDKATQSNAAGAEESAAASEELSAQAVVMRSTVRALQSLVSAAHASDDPGARTPIRNQVASTGSRPGTNGVSRSNGASRVSRSNGASHANGHSPSNGDSQQNGKSHSNGAGPSEGPAPEDRGFGGREQKDFFN